MKQKILFIHESMEGGGAEKVLSTILTNIDLEKFDITLLLIYGSGTYMKTIPQAVECISLFPSYKHPVARLLTHFRITRNFSRKSLALKKLKAKNFDTIVSFMEGPALKLHSQIMHLGKKQCTWLHCNQSTHHWYHKWISREEERDTYRLMDGIAAVSNGVKEAFTTLFDTDAKVEVIPNPVKGGNTDILSSTDKKHKNNVFKILSIGRLVEVKRFDRLLEAAQILKANGLDFHIDILGAGPLEKELKTMSDNLNIAEKITFHGFIENPAEFFYNADILCLTSDSEGFSLVVAEALSLGVPVVSTRVNGVVDMFNNGGGLITNKSAQDIASALKELIINPQKLARLKAQAVEASKGFDTQVIIKQIENFISI